MDSSKKEQILKILTLVVSILALLFVIFLILSRSNYEKLERQMVKNAKKYISENKIDVKNQEFLFERSDDWCATAYYYLNSPIDDMPEIIPYEERIKYLY